MSLPNKTLVIVQPYLPAYRVAFFDRLIDRLAADSIDCIVVAGEPDDEQARRGDAADADWLQLAAQRSVYLGRRSIKLGGTRKYWKNADAVIVGHVGSSLDAYAAIAQRVRKDFKVGAWGHIKSYVNTAHPLDVALERWQLRHVDHVFAYTPGGAEYALETGVPADRITTVMNTIDTSELQRHRDLLTSESSAEFCREHGIRAGHAAAYVGGLDSSKRIAFLAQSLDALWKLDPSVRILVAGRGVDAHLLSRSVDRGQTIMLGHADSYLKATIAAVSSALMMPGRIGLVAVDALVLDIPVVTTDWPFHAPESEYLQEGVNRFTSPNNPASYANYVVSVLKQQEAEKRSAPSTCFPTIDDMVENFALGVRKLLDS